MEIDIRYEKGVPRTNRYISQMSGFRYVYGPPRLRTIPREGERERERESIEVRAMIFHYDDQSRVRE